MDRLILSFRAKFVIPVVLALGVAAWLGLCRMHYGNYWAGTIYKVQTVDFNMLHQMLPPTLSQLIVAGRDDLIQQVLDSNYGIFGLVVTNPSGDSILYKTGKTYRRSSWQSLLSPDYLAKSTEPFDLLTDPPPLSAQYAHSSPRAATPKRIGPSPTGQVLGRIYYLRQPAPAFLDDVTDFVGGGLEISGAKRGYLFISFITIGFCLAVILLILWHKRGLELKQSELQQLQTELETRRKALDNLTSELVTQKARKSWLEQEARSAYQRAMDLKVALEGLRQSLNLANPEQAATPANPADVSSSRLLTELETLIPELTHNAQALQSQAGQLQNHCEKLEQRQAEMKRILEQAYIRTTGSAENILQFKPRPL